ncbi:MFS transporter [Desulfococcaceae bacterium HSG9]|nr:MFS transporter [Desulfococcaceae bacterium HSG9]
MKKTKPGLNAHERHVLITTCFGHFMSHFNMLAFPALVLPLTMRFDMEISQVLKIPFLMYLLFGVTALPWGIIADRRGTVSLFRIYYIGAGCSGLAAGIWLDSLIGLTLALASLGLFSGIYHPVGLGLISKEITRVSLGMGYNGMFGNLGLASSPLLIGLINWLYGPRAAYMFLGCLNLIGIGLMLLFPLPSGKGIQKQADKKDNGSLKPFLILLAAMMLGGIVYRGATVILPAYFELKTTGIYHWLTTFFNLKTAISPNLLATTITSLIFLTGMAGQYTGGRVAEHFDIRFCYLVFHVLTIPAAFLIAIATDIPLTGLAIVYLFFLLGMQPVENTLVANLTPKRLHHSAFGLKFILTFGIGAFAVLMAKSIQASYGIETVFVALGSISILLVSVILVLIGATRNN